MKLQPHKFVHELKANDIPPVAVDQFLARLRELGVTPKYPKTWKWQWVVTEKGPYTGTLAARLSKLCHQQALSGVYNQKLYYVSCAINVLRSHVVLNDTKVYGWISRTMTWRGGSFRDSGSCFWHGRSQAKHMLKENGAFSLRMFHDDSYSTTMQRGMGRGWLVPQGDSLYLFNVYGALTYEVVARMLQEHFAAETAVKCRTVNGGIEYGTLYINGGVSWRIGPANGPGRVDFGFPDFNYNWTFCATPGCRCSVQHTNTAYREKKFYCQQCRKQFARCYICGLYGRKEDMTRRKVRYAHNHCLRVDIADEPKTVKKRKRSIRTLHAARA